MRRSREAGPRGSGRWRGPERFSAVAVMGLLVQGLSGPPLAGQTDFYNLDKDRPLRVEDAYATKRWAFELQASPLTLSQDREGVLRYAPSVELKHGLLPGVEVSAGSHLELERIGGETSSSLGSLELSSLANLWVESGALPATGVRLTGHLPLESDGSGWAEIRALATRGLVGRWRAHLNGALMAGAGRPGDWWAGASVDHVLPFHHTLLLLETWVADVRAPAGERAQRMVHTGAGLRRQLSPTLALDAGVGHGWRGADRKDWVITMGITHEFGIRALMPSMDRVGTRSTRPEEGADESSADVEPR